MNIKCVVIDDEKLARDKIILFLKSIPNLELIGTFSTAESFLQKWQNAENLLIFLDINLPQLNGLELAEMVTKGNQIIFTTAYSEFALNGFELDAVDYLLKPFSFQRFSKAVNKAKDLFSSPEFILIKEGKKIHQLAFSEIFFVKGMKEYVRWHTQRGKIMEYNSLKNLEKKLKPKGFQQVHRSFIINFSKVEYFETNSVFINGKNIPIGRKFKPLLR